MMLTDAEKAALNREISELFQPVKSHGEVWTWVDDRDYDPRDWCSSEDASGWLLDRMPSPAISLVGNENSRPKQWMCNANRFDFTLLTSINTDRKTAIALAAREWLRRKQA